MKTAIWIQKHTSSLSGKTVAVSGATGGIGRELCRHLAALDARLLLLDRNQVRSADLERSLLADYPTLHIERIPLDLENIDNVRQTAKLLSKLPLDVLILNAGIYQVPRYKCSTGLDNVFQVNFLSPYYLVRTLLPHLHTRNAKVVVVGSIAHTNSPTDRNDIDFSTRSKSNLVYGNSKRFLMYAMYGLFGGQPGLSVVHPGITLTNISAHHPPLIFNLIKHPMKVIFMPPKKACLSFLAGIFDQCGINEWLGPKWFDIWGCPKKKSLNTCTAEEAAWIFETAEHLYQQMREIDSQPPKI